MSMLKIRGADGKIYQLVALKGDKGDPGGVTNAKDLAYDGEEQYIIATNVEDALKSTSDAIRRLDMNFSTKADYDHRHEAYEIAKFIWVSDEENPVAQNVDEAIDYLVDQVGNVSAALDELHNYAQALISGGDSE